jgi:hypothetical protein
MFHPYQWTLCRLKLQTLLHDQYVNPREGFFFSVEIFVAENGQSCYKTKPETTVDFDPTVNQLAVAHFILSSL